MFECIIRSVHFQQTEDNINQGVDYMLLAAESGDRSAMVYMAKAYETGVGLGTERYFETPPPPKKKKCYFLIIILNAFPKKS